MDDPCSGRALPGTERSKRYGGHGTPEVGEFAAGELGVLTHRSYGSAVALMADALDVRHRLPALWSVVMGGQARVWQARQVTKRTRTVGLTRSQAAWVDSQTTPYLASLPWTRFYDLLDAKIIEVDPKAAEARAEAAALDRFVTTGQSNEHGLKTLIAKAEAGEVIYFVAICDRIAQILLLQGDTDPVGVRRSKAIGILANPAAALRLLETHATPTTDPDDSTSEDQQREQESAEDLEPVSPGDLHPAADDSDDPRPCPTCGSGAAGVTGDPAPFVRPAAADLDLAKLLPKAVLYVHISREAFDAALAGELTGVARMEGVGPLTTGQAIRFLGHSHVTVKEVIDLEADHPVDAYEVPAKMREQLRLRSPAQVFPYAGLATVGMDGDHTRAFVPKNRGGPPGQTRIGNLGYLGRRLHRLKTHAKGWRHRQPSPGVHLWRSPHGYRFRVDATGTHPLGKMRKPHPDSTLERAFAEIIERLT